MKKYEIYDINIRKEGKMEEELKKEYYKKRYQEQKEKTSSVGYLLDDITFNKFKNKLSLLDTAITEFITSNMIEFNNNEEIQRSEEKKLRVIEIDKDNAITFNKKCKELKINKSELFKVWLKEYINE